MRRVFEDLASLEISPREIAMVWFNTYSGFAFRSIDATIVVDPYEIYPSDLDPLRIDALVVSHEHFDHYDRDLVVDIFERNNCTVIAGKAVYSDLSGRIPSEKLRRLLFGSLIEVGSFKIMGYKGYHPSMEPVTLLLEREGVRIYHMIDSRTFRELENLREKGIDIAIVPIGIAPGVDPMEGARAISMIRPRIAIPHHAAFGFEEFERLVSELAPGVEVRILDRGEIFRYEKSS